MYLEKLIRIYKPLARLIKIKRKVDYIAFLMDVDMFLEMNYIQMKKN